MTPFNVGLRPRPRIVAETVRTPADTQTESWWVKAQANRAGFYLAAHQRDQEMQHNRHWRSQQKEVAS